MFNKKVLCRLNICLMLRVFEVTIKPTIKTVLTATLGTPKMAVVDRWPLQTGGRFL